MGGARSSWAYLKSSNRLELKLNHQFSRTLVIQWSIQELLCSHQGVRIEGVTAAMNRDSVREEHS